MNLCESEIQQELFQKLTEIYSEHPEFKDLGEQDIKERAQRALTFYLDVRRRIDEGDHLTDRLYLKARYERMAGRLDPSQRPEDRPSLEYWELIHGAFQAKALFELHLQIHAGQSSPPNDEDEEELKKSLNEYLKRATFAQIIADYALRLSVPFIVRLLRIESIKRAWRYITRR